MTSHRNKRRLRALVALALVTVLALFAANCSGGSDGTTTPATTTTAAVEEAPVEPAPDPDEPDEVEGVFPEPEEALPEFMVEQLEAALAEMAAALEMSDMFDAEGFEEAFADLADEMMVDETPDAFADEQPSIADIPQEGEVEVEVGEPMTEADDQDEVAPVTEPQEDEAVSVTDPPEEVEDGPRQVVLICRAAQTELAEVYQVVFAALQYQVGTYIVHIEAHEVDTDEWATWGDVLDAEAGATLAQADAARAEADAEQACSGVSVNDYDQQAACANSSRDLLVAGQEYVDSLIGLHDAANQGASHIEAVESEVGLAQARAELAQAEAERSCSLAS